MASLLKFAAIVLSDCCCRFKSSTDCSPTGMKVLYVRIAATCGAVINFEAAYCCGASAFRSGIPRPPCAGGRVNSSCNSSETNLSLPKREETVSRTIDDFKKRTAITYTVFEKSCFQKCTWTQQRNLMLDIKFRNR